MWFNPYCKKRDILQDCVDAFARYHGMTYAEAFDFLKKTGAYKAIRKNWTYYAHLCGRHLVLDMRDEVLSRGHDCPPLSEPGAL